MNPNPKDKFVLADAVKRHENMQAAGEIILNPNPTSKEMAARKALWNILDYLDLGGFDDVTYETCRGIIETAIQSAQRQRESELKLQYQEREAVLIEDIATHLEIVADRLGRIHGLELREGAHYFRNKFKLDTKQLLRQYQSQAECDPGPLREAQDLVSKQRIEELEKALLEHRADLHNFSTRPCPTCRKSADVLGIQDKVPNSCAMGRFDRLALNSKSEEGMESRTE